VYENYSASVEFLSVSVDFVGQADTLERINAFRTSHGTPWTYAHDRDRVAREAYGVSATPTTFFLDRNGVIVHSIRGSAPGGIDAYAEWLDKAIRA
jgi:peroxiredoxin